MALFKAHGFDPATVAAGGARAALAMSRVRRFPASMRRDYQRHMLHAEDRVWVEKNCYVDVCIELLHALGLEPLAALGVVRGRGFRGRQFHFLQAAARRPARAVRRQHAGAERLAPAHRTRRSCTSRAGKFISTEADSFYLPDTAGTDYRRNHVKSTIILADLDTAARRLGYFHNAGYYALGGTTSTASFGLSRRAGTGVPSAVRGDSFASIGCAPAPEELGRIALGLLARNVPEATGENPIDAFRRRFDVDLPEIQARGIGHYHAWAFATVRQLGVAFELLALHVRWLVSTGADAALAGAADDFDRISAAAKALILKGARIVRPGKVFDAAATFDEMVERVGSRHEHARTRARVARPGVRGAHPVTAPPFPSSRRRASASISCESAGRRVGGTLRRALSPSNLHRRRDRLCAEAPALSAERLAARFAAKEAAMKALRLAGGLVTLREIEVHRTASGECEVVLHGRARSLAALAHTGAIALSLSHEGDYAAAMVITHILESAAMNERDPHEIAVAIRRILKEHGHLSRDADSLGAGDRSVPGRHDVARERQHHARARGSVRRGIPRPHAHALGVLEHRLDAGGDVELLGE